MATPVEEYRVELLTRLAAADPAHTIYETSLPPADVPHPFYYFDELRTSDDRSCKLEVTQDVYHTISVWHDNPDQKAQVLRMLATIGEVIRAMELAGTHSYHWMVVDTGMRVLADNISGQVGSSVKTKYVHGIYEVHMKQIGPK